MAPPHALSMGPGRPVILLLAAIAAACGRGGGGSAPAPAPGVAALEEGPILDGALLAPTDLPGTWLAAGDLDDLPGEGAVTYDLEPDGSATLYVSSGRADGSFQPAAFVRVAGLLSDPFGVVAAGDIVLCDPGAAWAVPPIPGRILLSRRNPDGSFAAPATWASGVWPLAAAAWNGAAYVLAAREDVSDLIRIDRGIVTYFPLPFRYDYLAAGAFDAPPSRFLAVAPYAFERVDFLSVTAGGAEVWTSATVPGAWITGLAAGDLAGDARADLAVRAIRPDLEWTERVTVFSGSPFEALGDFGRGGSIRDFGVAGAELRIAEWFEGADTVDAYVDGDAVPLVEGDRGALHGRILGTRWTYLGGRAERLAFGGSPRAVAAADFNLDGTVDLAAVRSPDGDVVLLDGPVTSAGLPDADEALAGDVDGDALPDLVVRAGGHVYLLRGDGAGGFASPEDLGVADAVALHGDGFAWTDLYAQELHVRRADGTATTLAVPGGPLGLASADFDGDGAADLAVAVPDEAAPRLAILIGGTETWSAPLDALPGTLAAGDFDGDGLIDLAVARALGSLWFLRGVGDGSFEPPREMEGGRYEVLKSADLDGDGLAETLALDRTDGLVVVLRGDPIDPLAAAERYAVPDRASSLAVCASGVVVGNAAGSGYDDPALLLRRP